MKASTAAACPPDCRRPRAAVAAAFPALVLPMVAVVAIAVSAARTDAADWPMWRCDAARSGATEQPLPAELRLQWVRELPKLKPAYRESRLQFDAGYEPVVAGQTMFVGSSHSHSVMALDTATGALRWEHFVGGPVRMAPAVWRGRVFFGADDGRLRCVDAGDGRLLWSFQAVPSQRQTLGNGQMISPWPVRGGPVAHEGRVYFAAGVWPFEGVFIYCLDAASGAVVWRNDDSSFVYGQHPHDAQAIGGVTPQGYLVVAGDELIVPCGQAMPAAYDLQTGKLKSFELPKPGRRPGGWLVSSDVRRGLVVTDADINRDLHEDKIYQGPGSPGVRATITVAGEARRFGDRPPEVKSDIHTMLAADDRLFVVDVDGRIYSFGKASGASDAAAGTPPAPPQRSAKSDRVERILQAVTARHGCVLLRSLVADADPEQAPHAPAGREEAQREEAQREEARRAQREEARRDLTERIDTLLRETEFQVIAVHADERLLTELRAQYRDVRQRLGLLADAGGRLELPPYFASLWIGAGGRAPSREELESLRPYGGEAWLSLTDAEHAQLPEDGFGAEFSIERLGGMTRIRRAALAGAVNYTGGWSSADERVRAPLGVLWFDDTLGHFKRSPQPWFVDGVMISYLKNWMEKHDAGRKPPYRLLPPIFSDVYTGRILPEEDAILSKVEAPRRDLSAPTPSQYRPPTQLDAWNPKQPLVGERRNPLTGELEPRTIPKSYGCDGGVDYGHLFTMRSGTPAFYDKRLESGVCSISGPRSGCTNSLIPACGVLNVPFFYEGCTCSYPLPVGLALVSRPPQHEQWSSWGPGKAGPLQRVGINFGAPGDRMAPEGTLWLDYPSRGGPSPDVDLRVAPETAEYFYQHSLFADGAAAWPWVAASGVEGARDIRIGGLRPGEFTVRLYFIEPEIAGRRIAGKELAGKELTGKELTGKELAGAARRRFDIRLNGAVVAEDFDIEAICGARMRPLMRSCQGVKTDGELRIELIPREGRTILSGVEIVAKGLDLGPQDSF